MIDNDGLEALTIITFSIICALEYLCERHKIKFECFVVRNERKINVSLII